MRTLQKRLIKTLLTLGVLGTFPTAAAQSTQFQYAYDAAGNRTERNMIVLQIGQPGGNQAAQRR